MYDHGFRTVFNVRFTPLMRIELAGKLRPSARRLLHWPMMTVSHELSQAASPRRQPSQAASRHHQLSQAEALVSRAKQKALVSRAVVSRSKWKRPKQQAVVSSALQQAAVNQVASRFSRVKRHAVVDQSKQ